LSSGLVLSRFAGALEIAPEMLALVRSPGQVAAVVDLVPTDALEIESAHVAGLEVGARAVEFDLQR
jgi:hypothetical protein